MANLEDRLSLLEQKFQQLSDQVQMEAGLAAARDRDLSNLTVVVNSHTAMIQAVQERQAEHTERFDAIDEQLRALGRGYVELHAGQQTIVQMLSTLIERDQPEA